ncbi:EspG family protein [Streptoalloteichus tenebrarius]|uniref:EspG family protein n=1 Tax=Streptoalloteichus tenebrarius (strain ATCC 17920 / DSM 40477 / JCM 4838 / CBS 697.72 / NBRC 16177 / NCIMB 11028 / NRRL B-12390 / A12253. 1 / ISP 5477) TaxID=1933 RepID=A0ABT1HXV0_STRSD|nr:ESX secretion-associated protein EspG [Streptoalloteichus tenebrarius]MCP2260339.1 EspG family protein [Streptoalloteichus tenebrarius]BFF03091.1 hypothetical protein GCM10020241_47660 [Streptoalloteichus tenebrarius]
MTADATGSLRVSSEELEVLLFVLGEAAALPGRMVSREQTEHMELVREVAARSLLARGLVTGVEGGYRVEPTLAEALAVPTRQVLAFEADLEREGRLVRGAAATDGERGLLVLPSVDGTVALRWFPAHELARAVVASAGHAEAGRADLRVPAALLVEPPVDLNLELDVPAAVARGASPEAAAALAEILAARHGSGRVAAVRPVGDGWVESAAPVAWWDTDRGRFLVTPGGPGPDGARTVRVSPGGDEELVGALAGLAATVS